MAAAAAKLLCVNRDTGNYYYNKIRVMLLRQKRDCWWIGNLFYRVCLMPKWKGGGVAGESGCCHCEQWRSRKKS
jgi:hypothetical protein